MARKRFLLTIMFCMVSVVVYALALFQSIRAYESLKEAILEDPPGFRAYVDFSPYIFTRQGGQMTGLGALIFIGYPIVLLLFSVKHQFVGDEEC